MQPTLFIESMFLPFNLQITAIIRDKVLSKASIDPRDCPDHKQSPHSSVLDRLHYKRATCLQEGTSAYLPRSTNFRSHLLSQIGCKSSSKQLANHVPALSTYDAVHGSERSTYGHSTPTPTCYPKSKSSSYTWCPTRSHSSWRNTRMESKHPHRSPIAAWCLHSAATSNETNNRCWERISFLAEATCCR